MKIAKTALASALLLSTAIGTAHAEICYKLTPFIDVIRLAETTSVDEAAGGSHTPHESPHFRRDSYWPNFVDK
jgi:hypothetical protein